MCHKLHNTMTAIEYYSPLTNQTEFLKIKAKIPFQKRGVGSLLLASIRMFSTMEWDCQKRVFIPGGLFSLHNLQRSSA